MKEFFVSIGKLIALILFGVFIYYGYQFVDTFTARWTPTHVLLWVSIYVLLVVVGVTSFVGACFLLFRTAMEIFNGLAALITQIISNIFAVIMGNFTPPIEAEVGVGESVGGGSVPTPEPLYFHPDEIGGKVKRYLEATNDYKFSLTNYPNMEKLYNYIGYRPGGKNKQDENYNFGRFLLAAKIKLENGDESLIFEQEETFIKIRPIHWKTVQENTKVYFEKEEHKQNKVLDPEVRDTYSGNFAGQKTDTSRTLVGQE